MMNSLFYFLGSKYKHIKFLGLAFLLLNNLAYAANSKTKKAHNLEVSLAIELPIDQYSYEICLEENGEITQVLDEAGPFSTHASIDEISFGYRFEKMQNLLLTIYDNEKREIAFGTIPVAKIVTKKKNVFEIEVNKSTDIIGRVEISDMSHSSASKDDTDLEEKLKQTEPYIEELASVVQFDAKATKDRKGLLKQYKMHFTIGNLFASKAANNGTNPSWYKNKLSVSKDTESLVFNVFNGSKKLGSFTVNYDELIAKDQHEFEITRSQGGSSKKIGTFSIDNLMVEEELVKKPNPEYGKLKSALEALNTNDALISEKFLDLMESGLEISVQFGIDFTSSNGSDIHSKSSLHHLSKSKENPYQEAIRKVGDIVAQYDEDQQFPVFGYGCQVPKGSSYHFPPFFNVNLKAHPDCSGINGVLAAYRETLPQIRMGDMGSADHHGYKGRFYGDDFHQLISGAVKSLKKNDNKYKVLVLVIDGDYFDNQATKDAIIEAEDYPISIIIIGVGGNRNFPNCRIFDADDERLVHSNGRVQKRDIVQFVKFDDYKHNLKLLTDEVLYELPSQIVKYKQLYR